MCAESVGAPYYGSLLPSWLVLSVISNPGYTRYSALDNTTLGVNFEYARDTAVETMTSALHVGSFITQWGTVLFSNPDATIKLSFGSVDSHSASVYGLVTDAEWTGVADKIKTALNNAYTAAPSATQTNFTTVFGRPYVRIYVEKTTAYATWKTTGNGRELYIRLDKVDTIQSAITNAINAMNSNTATNG